MTGGIFAPYSARRYLATTQSEEHHMGRQIPILALVIALAAAGCGGTSEATVATKAVDSHFGVNNAKCASWGTANVAGTPADTFKCSVTLDSQAQVENAQGCQTPLCAPANETQTLYIAVRDGHAFNVTP